MGESSACLFTSRGTPTSSDSSGSSGPEDDYSIPQAVNEHSRYCPCCCRIFARDFFLFGHLRRSKKCKILCGEQGCERPIEGIHEMLMCYNSRHRFHCQKCERRFKSWGGLHKHFFSSRDCFKRREYKFKGRGAAKPQVTHYKPGGELGPVSRATADAPAPSIYLTNGRRTVDKNTAQKSRRTALLENSDVGGETKLDRTEEGKNDGKLNVHWET